MALFVTEGFLLGVLGTAAGTVISLVSIAVINAGGLTFNFGRQSNLVLAPTIGAGDVITIVLIVIGIAVAASLQPAFKAARMNPITAFPELFGSDGCDFVLLSGFAEERHV